MQNKNNVKQSIIRKKVNNEQASKENKQDKQLEQLKQNYDTLLSFKDQFESLKQDNSKNNRILEYQELVKTNQLMIQSQEMNQKNEQIINNIQIFHEQINDEKHKKNIEKLIKVKHTINEIRNRKIKENLSKFKQKVIEFQKELQKDQNEIKNKPKSKPSRYEKIKQQPLDHNALLPQQDNTTKIQILVQNVKDDDKRYHVQIGQLSPPKFVQDGEKVILNALQKETPKTKQIIIPYNFFYLKNQIFGKQLDTFEK